MPRMADGTIVRARYTKLDLSELSAVDRPAQPGATMAIMKRDDSVDLPSLQLVAKYVCEEDGAHSFVEVLRENEFSQKIWPFTDALTQSIRSIVGDKRLSGEDREARVTESVASFLQKVREIAPQVAKQLEGLVSKKDGPMPKSIEQLEADLAKAQGDLTTMTARAEKAETDLAAMTEAKDKAEADCAEAKKGLDETITVGGAEVKKSEIGETQFAVMKGLADERDLARLEKRADADYRHVVGKTEEKAQVLQAVEKIADEPTRKAAMAIIDSAEKMAKGAFDMLGGHGGAGPTEEQATAKREFDAEVQKNVDAGLKPTEAMSKARREHAELFNKSQGDEAQAQ